MAFRLIKSFSNTFAALLIAFVVGLSVRPAAATASTYGSGHYGACTYSQGCSTPTTTSTGGSTPTTTTSPTAILLNDFEQYFASGGKTLDLKVDQVIYFDVTVGGVTERHSVTIKKIGPDYVILTLASEPFDVTLFVGDTKQYDVNNDGQNDIEISLNSISTNGKANLTFRALKPPAAAPAATAPAQKHTNWLWIIVSIALIIIALIIFIWLFARRRRRDEPGPH